MSYLLISSGIRSVEGEEEVVVDGRIDVPHENLG